LQSLYVMIRGPGPLDHTGTVAAVALYRGDCVLEKAEKISLEPAVALGESSRLIKP
jgi:acyl-CoA hydrolase